jgi:hypothetical protein
MRSLTYFRNDSRNLAKKCLMPTTMMMRMKMRTTRTTMRRMSKIKASIVLCPSSCAFRSWARAYARYLEMAMTRLIDWFSPHPLRQSSIIARSHTDVPETKLLAFVITLWSVI